MANYQNSDMKKAEDVFVIKQPHHKEEDFGSFWGYGGIYSKSKVEGASHHIVMDKYGNDLLLNETEFTRINK